jgi:hypothetical protein
MSIVPSFAKAFHEDQEIAIRIVLWARDIRGGAGERQLFRNIFGYIIAENKALAIRLIPKIPELGRWDDLLAGLGTWIESNILFTIKQALLNQNGLCAKWMPRQGPVANIIRKYLKLSPKRYRKMLVELTNVVESKMCKNKWNEIEYKTVPSLAQARYSKAFNRHDTQRYEQYINELKNKTTTINADAVYPYDIIKTIKHSGNSSLADEQWKALPDYCDGTNILPIIDVSGSMDFNIGKNLKAIDIAISLGIYLSEKNKGAFKNHFITFSERPSLQHLSGNLRNRLSHMEFAQWGFNTNLEAVFDLILSASRRKCVAPEHMPEMILIISDMEFDEATNNEHTAMDMIKNEYEKHNYRVPELVFWNLHSRHNNVPVTINEQNVALVSGFSPAIMKSILKAEEFSPEGIMLETIMNERYNYERD